MACKRARCPRAAAPKFDDATFRRSALRQVDVETVRGGEARRALRPFNDGGAVSDEFVESDFDQIVVAPEAIEIQMRKLEARRRIRLNEREGRARNLGLSIAEIARKCDDVALRELQRNALRQVRDRCLIGINHAPIVLLLRYLLGHSSALGHARGSVP
jgi:hypothetical protein